MDPFVPEEKPISPELREAMRRRSDYQLILTLYEERGLYDREAVRAAQWELERRFPDNKERKAVIQGLIRLAQERKLAEKEALEGKWQLIVFLFPLIGFFIVNIFVVQAEEKRKMQDTMTTLLLSLVFWAMVFVRIY